MLTQRTIAPLVGTQYEPQAGFIATIATVDLVTVQDKTYLHTQFHWAAAELPDGQYQLSRDFLGYRIQIDPDRTTLAPIHHGRGYQLYPIVDVIEGVNVIRFYNPSHRFYLPRVYVGQ